MLQFSANMVVPKGLEDFKDRFNLLKERDNYQSIPNPKGVFIKDKYTPDWTIKIEERTTDQYMNFDPANIDLKSLLDDMLDHYKENWGRFSFMKAEINKLLNPQFSEEGYNLFRKASNGDKKIYEVVVTDPRGKEYRNDNFRYAYTTDELRELTPQTYNKVADALFAAHVTYTLDEYITKTSSKLS